MRWASASQSHLSMVVVRPAALLVVELRVESAPGAVRRVTISRVWTYCTTSGPTRVASLVAQNHGYS
jgi:hypothetical protein